MCLEMLHSCGRKFFLDFCNSDILNHFASSISFLSSWRSPSEYYARKANMRELGNGHAWLPKYDILVTLIPTSSLTSR